MRRWVIVDKETNMYVDNEDKYTKDINKAHIFLTKTPSLANISDNTAPHEKAIPVEVTVVLLEKKK